MRVRCAERGVRRRGVLGYYEELVGEARLLGARFTET